MIDKEIKIEWIKFFIRVAEIVLLGMIVAPVGAYVLKRDTDPGSLILAIILGLP